ncbi:hypothetical protein BX661DRAFT_180976 [Kickxella alabastrina]|uniref:uncharacterized protein n=1 Tax=Kickxella alabastrina TaxID=61397 RepID=UPI00221E9B6E|nr:uncharacterized protein BX661DRAFT_180976 [Kickxella alabastrina]KAI7830036.1 hypothetical protein BX661DRAFT_180976 [Kickxella alabastrina]
MRTKLNCLYSCYKKYNKDKGQGAFCICAMSKNTCLQVRCQARRHGKQPGLLC